MATPTLSPSDNEHRKKLHVMFRGSWAITYRCVIKILHRKIAAVAPAPKATPHRKWVETPIGFDASDCPKSMAGAWQLPLLVSPTITNVKLYHVLIDDGATLNLSSLTTFKKLQIPMGNLKLSRPFSGVGLVAVMPRSCISLPVTYGRSTILGGWPILWLSLRSMGSFGCASTTQVSIRHV
jgi:hypothetical protein